MEHERGQGEGEGEGGKDCEAAGGLMMGGEGWARADTERGGLGGRNEGGDA